MAGGRWVGRANARDGAGLIGTDAYLGEWRREPRECSEDLETEVAEEVAWLEGAYGDDVLERLVASNGHDS